MTLPTLDALAAFLHDALGAAAYPPDERGGVFRAPARTGDAATRPLTRLGLALEPWPGLRAWAAHEALDGVFLHRPWRLQRDALPPSVGVLHSHLPFDDHLATGDNVPLAAALGFHSREVLGVKDGRRIGMLGDIDPITAAEAVARVAATFGGTEAVVLPDPARRVARVAVVGAMNDALVREAVARGAGLYVTGQLRAPARAAVTETGIAITALGHTRSERWGLRALADLVCARWPALATVVAAA